MQPRGIRSAQLLMEVAAGAQDKIGQEISRSGFSQQLAEQRQLSQNTPFVQPEGTFVQANRLQKPVTTSAEMPSSLPAGSDAKISEHSSNCSSKVSALSSGSTSASDLAMSKWKTAHELTFSDSMALEKVLVQLHLAPSVRSEIKNALDNQGQISLHKLNEILDRAASSKAELPADGKVAVDEIQSLLAGMVQQQSSIQNLQELGIRLKGSYALGEFRDLLRRLVDRTASEKLDQAARSSLKRITATNPAAESPAGSAPVTSRARLSNQTQSLTNNLVPSFLGEEKDKSRKTDSSSLILTAPVANGNGTKKTGLLAGEETGQRKGSLGGQEPRQLKGTAKPLNTGFDSAPLASPNSLKLGLQSISSTPVSTGSMVTLLGTVPNSVSESRTIPTEGPQLSVGIESDTFLPASIDRELTLTQPEGRQQTTAWLTGNVAHNGEAVIRGLRLDSVLNTLNSATDPGEAALSDKPSPVALEKTAAPASSEFSSNQSGFSEKRSFTSNESIMSSNRGEAVSEQVNQVPSLASENSDADVAYDSLTKSTHQTGTSPKEQNTAGSNRILGQSNGEGPTTATTTAGTETTSNVEALLNQESLTGEANPDLKDSVELLAKSEDTSQATAARSGSTSKEAADQATRSNSIETNSKETPTDKNPMKVSSSTNTPGQFTQDQKSQDNPLSFHRDSVQMMSTGAASSVQNGTEVSAYSTSSLTAELAQRIQDLYQQKGVQFVMELHPKHLGRLVVRIGTDANQVKALISTESEQVRELLTKTSPLLRQELASQGLVLEQLQIDVNTQTASQDKFLQKRSRGSAGNGGSSQSATLSKVTTKTGVSKPQLGHANNLISLFV